MHYEWGDDALERFNGMFGIGFLDREEPNFNASA